MSFVKIDGKELNYDQLAKEFEDSLRVIEYKDKHIKLLSNLSMWIERGTELGVMLMALGFGSSLVLIAVLLVKEATK